MNCVIDKRRERVSNRRPRRLRDTGDHLGAASEVGQASGDATGRDL